VHAGAPPVTQGDAGAIGAGAERTRSRRALRLAAPARGGGAVIASSARAAVPKSRAGKGVSKEDVAVKVRMTGSPGLWVE